MAPLSGSRKTKIEGISVTKITFNINIVSDFTPVLLKETAILLSIIARLNLASSLGWKENPLILIQALAPLITLPKSKTYKSNSKEIIYKTFAYLNIVLFLFILLGMNVFVMIVYEVCTEIIYYLFKQCVTFNQLKIKAKE